MTTKLIGVKEFRRNLATYAQRARRRGFRYIVLNKNVPLLDVRPLSEKDLVLERLIDDVGEARAQARRGAVKSLEEVQKEYTQFGIPSVRSRRAIVQGFRKTGRYSPAFIKSLARGLKRSAFFTP